jgi:hypothetical protein
LARASPSGIATLISGGREPDCVFGYRASWRVWRAVGVGGNGGAVTGPSYQ